MFIKIVQLINNKTNKYLKRKLGINKELNKYLNHRRLKHNGIRVSDHAILRYFERFEDYDIDKIADYIAKDVKIKPGVNKQNIGNKTVVIENNMIITIFQYIPTGNNKIRFK